MRATRWQRFFYSAGLAALGLGIVWVSNPSLCLAAGSGVKLTVSFDHDRLSIEAENASLERILEIVSDRVGFSVSRAGSRYAPPPVTGHKTGNLDDILAWLLSGQNYVLLRGRVYAGGEIFDGRPTKLLLMNSPSRETVNVAAARDRTGYGTSGFDIANRVQRAAPESIEAFRGLAAVETAVEPGRGQGATATAGTAPSEGVERLSRSGNRLSNIVIDTSNADIIRTVDLAGDAPVATHVMLHQAAGPSLQRTDRGIWISWDGREESLVDNKFVPADGAVTFEVVKGDLSDEFFPMTFTVAYRTDTGLKFGSFQVMPDQQIPL